MKSDQITLCTKEFRELVFECKILIKDNGLLILTDSDNIVVFEYDSKNKNMLINFVIMNTAYVKYGFESFSVTHQIFTKVIRESLKMPIKYIRMGNLYSKDHLRLLQITTLC